MGLENRTPPTAIQDERLAPLPDTTGGGALNQRNIINEQFYARKDDGFLNKTIDFVKQTAEEMVGFFPRWWQSAGNVNKELKKTYDKHGWGPTANVWWHGTRATLSQFGVPDTSDEEKIELAQSLNMLSEHGTEESIKEIEKYLKDTFAKGGLSDEEFKAGLRGGLDLITVPTLVMGPAGPGVTAGIRGGFAGLKAGLSKAGMKKLLAMEAHSVATAAGYEAARAAIEDREVGKSAAIGAGFGLVGPLAIVGGANVAGALVRGGGRVVGKGLQKGLQAGAQTVKYTKGKVDPIIEAQLKRTGTYNSARQMQDWWNRQLDHKVFSGAGVLKKYGQEPLLRQLVKVRWKFKVRAGVWTARYYNIIDDLSSAERVKLQEVLNADEMVVGDLLTSLGGDEALTAKMVEKSASLRNLLREVAGEAEGAGVSMDWGEDNLRFFVSRKDFGVPHIIVDTEQYIKPGPMRKRALDAIMKTDPNISEKTAANILQELHEHNTQFIKVADFKGLGNVTLKGRQYNLPGYVEDPNQTLPHYFARMSQQIEQAKEFRPRSAMDAIDVLDPETGALEKAFLNKRGAKNQFPLAFRSLEIAEKLEELLKKSKLTKAGLKTKAELEKELVNLGVDPGAIPNKGQRKIATEIIKRQLEGFDLGTEGQQIMNKMAQWQVIMKLGLSQFTQLTQFGAATVQTGYRGAFKDLIRTFRDPSAHRFALKAGAILESTVREAEMALMGGGSAQAQQTLRKIGFTFFDVKARVFGAIRGASMAQHASEDMAKLLKKGVLKGADAKKMRKLQKKFLELGFDENEITAIANRGGELTEEEVLRAGLKISSDVNFFGDAISLPAYWKSPTGRFLTQFKSFSFQQSVFMKKAVLDPLYRDGDVEPLARALVAMGVTGEVVRDIKDIMKGKKIRQDVGLKRFWENALAGGGFGIMMDGVNATGYKGGFINMLQGPTIGDIGLGVDAVGQAVRGNPKLLEQRAAHTLVPIVAQHLPYGQSWGPIISQFLTQRIKEGTIEPFTKEQ